jgi:hypothetical protein
MGKQAEANEVTTVIFSFFNNLQIQTGFLCFA